MIKRNSADMRALPVYIALFLGFVLDAGCRPAEPAPVITLRHGAFEVEILASEGILKQGPNHIQLQVREDSAYVSFKKVRLAFTMPHLGGESYLEEDVEFLASTSPGLCNGQITFDRPGRWKGKLRIEAPEEIIACSFYVDVVEPLH